jgi:Tfp pilus assembly protein PilN
MIKINLIPPEYIAKINRKVVIAKVVLGVVVSAAVIMLVSSWHFGRSKRLEMRLSDLEAEMVILQKDVDRVKEIEKQIAEVQKYLDSINSINKNRFVYTSFLRDLVGDLPGTIWFNNVNTTLSGSVVSVSMTINSNSAYDLAYWLNSLETSGQYKEVTIGSISVSELETGKRFTAPLTMKYNYK